MLLGVVLAVLGIWLFVRSVIRTPASRQRAEAATGESATSETVADDQRIAPVTRREAGFVGATFALLILYAFLLDKVGFIIGTPIVMVLALTAILRVRRWLTVVAFAVGVTFVCWLIFAALLATPLPRGTWMAWL
jgi:putative tricarboxylic transport membrane protein